jgi:hypothetical protein
MLAVASHGRALQPVAHGASQPALTGLGDGERAKGGGVGTAADLVPGLDEPGVGCLFGRKALLVAFAALVGVISDPRRLFDPRCGSSKCAYGRPSGKFLALAITAVSAFIDVSH